MLPSTKPSFSPGDIVSYSIPCRASLDGWSKPHPIAAIDGNHALVNGSLHELADLKPVPAGHPA